MIAKILVGVVALIGLAGGGYYAAGDSANCCYPGSACCFPGSPCCDEEPAAATPDCCFPGSPCCDDQAACCLTQDAAPKAKSGCCAGDAK